MFTKNSILFLFGFVSAISDLSALPVSLIKNRAAQSIFVNAFELKTQSVARIKKLEIPFTTWLKFREAIIDGKEHCPEKILKIIVGSKKWSLWVNELGIWAIVVDEAMPLSPSDQKPLLLVSFYNNPSMNAVSILVNDEAIEMQI